MSSNPGKSIELAAFQHRVQSRVIGPLDPEYDGARRAWNLVFDQHPAAVMMAQNAADIAEAVRFAQKEGLGVAVMGGGHGTVVPADGGLLINTSAMQGIDINTQAQTARIEAGVKWGSVLEKAQAAGLAPLLGSSPDVGAVGYSLGGGLGWLARKYGLAADSVLSFDVVTADGRLQRAAADENVDLFWAMRGGGGGFAIVTAMEVRLYPVSEVYAGNLYYPVEQAHEVFVRYREWIKGAPDELSTSVLIMNYPPLEMIPEFLRGKSFAIVRGCYCGDLAEGKALVQSWRDWQAPIIDDFKAIPFSQAKTISNDPEGPLPGLSSGGWLSDLSDEVIDIVLDYAVSHQGPPPFVFAEVRRYGGAVARVDPASAAFSHRDAEHLLQVIGIAMTPEMSANLKTAIGGLVSELKPHFSGSYMNFLEGGESRTRVQEGFSADHYQRLTEIKAKYDPENRFSYAIQIPPAG